MTFRHSAGFPAITPSPRFSLAVALHPCGYSLRRLPRSHCLGTFRSSRVDLTMVKSGSAERLRDNHTNRLWSRNRKTKKAGVHPDLSTLRLQPERHALHLQMVVPDYIEPVSSFKRIIMRSGVSAFGGRVLLALRAHRAR